MKKLTRKLNTLTMIRQMDGKLKPEVRKGDKKSFVLYSDYELDGHGNAVKNTINHNGKKPETVVRSIIYY